MDTGRAGEKRCGNRDCHTGLFVVVCLGKGVLLNHRVPWDKEAAARLRALPCPGPQQLPAAPAHSSQQHLATRGGSSLRLHPSLRDALSLPPWMRSAGTCPGRVPPALGEREWPQSSVGPHYDPPPTGKHTLTCTVSPSPWPRARHPPVPHHSTHPSGGRSIFNSPV